MAKRETVIPDKYKHLLDTISPDGIEITESVLRTALNKLIGCRRRPMGKSATLTQIYETISDEDIFKNIKSASNLKSGNGENFIAPKKKTEDVKNMSFDLEEFAGYSEEEKRFIQSRLCEYQGFYSLEGPNDKFGILDVIDIELQIQEVKKYLRVHKPKDTTEHDKKLGDLRKQWSALLKDLNLTKLQRDNPKNKKEESNTDIIADKLKEADKSIEELEKEAAAKKQEVENRLAERRSRS